MALLYEGQNMFKLKMLQSEPVTVLSDTCILSLSRGNALAKQQAN